MIIEMALAFPLLKKMHDRGRECISNQFVPGAAGFAADHWYDLLYFPDKLFLPFRHEDNPCINKYHTSSVPRETWIIVKILGPVFVFMGYSLIMFSLM